MSRQNQPVIRGICFDFDGVLVDSAGLKTEAFVELYADRDSVIREEIRQFCSVHGGLSRYRKIEHIQTNILGEPIPQIAADELADRFRDLVLEHVLAAPLIHGALEFLEANHDSSFCFVVSGTPEEEIRHICAHRGIEQYFKGIGGSPSRKAELIMGFLGAYGLVPSEAVMIGDAPTDLEAARETGTHFVGVGTRPESFLPQEHELIPDLTSLARRLQSLR